MNQGSSSSPRLAVEAEGEGREAGEAMEVNGGKCNNNSYCECSMVNYAMDSLVDSSTTLVNGEF